MDNWLNLKPQNKKKPFKIKLKKISNKENKEDVTELFLTPKEVDDVFNDKTVNTPNDKINTKRQTPLKNININENPKSVSSLS